VLRQLEIKQTALFHLCSFERGQWLERKAGLLDEAEEAGVVLVALGIQRTGEQVLAEVVRQLLLVGEVAVAGIETLGQ